MAVNFYQDLNLNGQALTGYSRTGAKAVRVSVQSLASAVLTTVVFEGETFDTGNYYDPLSNQSRMTVPENGLYLITGQLYFPTNGNGARRAQLRRNGINVEGEFQVPAVASSPTIIQISDILNLSQGNYVEIRAYQDSGSILDLQFPETWLAIAQF